MPCLMPAWPTAQAQHSLYPVAPLVRPSLDGAQDSAPCTHVCEAPGARAGQRQDPVSFPLNPSPISVLVIETSIKIQVTTNIISRETIFVCHGEGILKSQSLNYSQPCVPRSPSWNYFAKNSNGIDCAFFLEQLTAQAKRGHANRSSRFLQLLTLKM